MGLISKVKGGLSNTKEKILSSMDKPRHNELSEPTLIGLLQKYTSLFIPL